MKRIEIIDAIRGFSLLLILLIRASDNFGVTATPEEPLINTSALDGLVSAFIYYFVKDKAFAIFSLMFGLSFFIQLDRNASRNVNFNMLFIKRLVLLLMLGYLHAMLYKGDILTKYAILGLPLIFINKLNNKWLLALAVLFLMQWIYLIPLMFNIPKLHFGPSETRIEEIWASLSYANSNGTLLDLIKVNSWTGFLENWRLNILNGRLMLIFGYFLLGLYIGRMRFFEKIEEYLKSVRITIAIAIAAYGLLFILLNHIIPQSGMSSQKTELARLVLTSYSNTAMMIIMLTGFILLYQIGFIAKISRIFIPYGKMSLTSYVFQGLIGMTLFYNFGFGLYSFTTPALSILAAIVIFLAQLIFAIFWLKYFRYGPLEYVWRSLTLGSFKQPMLKKRIIP